MTSYVWLFVVVFYTGQITAIESLFEYPSMMSVEDYARRDHVPIFLDEVLAAADDSVRILCNDDPQCIFDTAQTGSEEVGMATLATDESNNMQQMQASQSLLIV